MYSKRSLDPFSPVSTETLVKRVKAVPDKTSPVKYSMMQAADDRVKDPKIKIALIPVSPVKY